MAKLRLETGQVINFEGDPTQAQIENAIGQVTGKSQLRTEATKEEFLPVGERFKGGFRRGQELEQVREQQRAERGLAPGTPLEPTGLNLENLLDLPKDLADMVGPAFPVVGTAVGATVAGVGTLPLGPGAILAAIKGGGIGGAAAQAARQEVGLRAFGFDQGTAIERLGDVAKEGALGATQEVGGVFLRGILSATKKGILKAANTLVKHRGAEGFVKGFGSIATHMDPEKTKFALDAVKKGDKRVLRMVFADREFADKFAERLFKGPDKDIAKQMFRLSHRPEAKGAVGDLYKRFFPKQITDDVFETVFKKGAAIKDFNKPGTILRLGNKINSGLDDLFNTSGKQLGNARLRLAKQAKNIRVGNELSQINTSLANELSSVGFLVKEGDGLFSINPSFAGTTTGSAQAKMFGQLVTRFFKSEGDDALIAAARRGDKEALIRLANKVTKGRRKIFSVANDINFEDFSDKLRSIDVQISGNEFKALGKLSPQLAQYLEGLRSIPIAVEAQIGGSEVKILTNTFREFSEGAKLLRQGSKVKNPAQIEKALQRFTRTEPGTAAAAEVGELNNFLQKNLKVNFLEDLRTFKAAQRIKELEGTFGTTQGRTSLVSAMKTAFGDDIAPVIRDIERTIDPVLPKGLRIADNARTHTVARDLHRNAASLLRARFLINALFAGAGFQALGPTGGIVGLGAGLALQNPGILRSMIQASAKLSTQQIKQLAVQGLGATTQQVLQRVPAGARLLQKLIQQR